MALIFGSIMAIGGIVMCFTGKLEIGVLLYAIAGGCFSFWDISMAIRTIANEKKVEQLGKSIEALQTIDDILNRLEKEGKNS